jgi:hypothetical protein
LQVLTENDPHDDIDKAQQRKREVEKELHPNGTGLDACADFNDLY